MRKVLTGVATGIVMLGLVGACAAQTTTPDAALKEIGAWYAAEIKKARDAGQQPNMAVLRSGQLERARAAADTFKAAEVEPVMGLALGQLYQMAQRPADGIVAVKRFLTGSPEPAPKYQAQSLLLTLFSQTDDGKGIAATVPVMKPADARTAAMLAFNVAGNYAETVANKVGLKEALALIDHVEKQVALDQITEERDKPMVEAFPVQMALGRAELLDGAGKQADAIKVLEAAKGKVAQRLQGQIASKLTLLKIVGTQAPALQRERGYGEFPGLAALKGKVVLVDFGAHWCGFCKLGYPSLKKLQEELGPKGLEVVGVTTYYGFYGNERNLTPDQEFAKYAEHVKEFGFTWPVVFGPRANSEAYGVGGIPHYVLVDRKGKVVKVQIGFSEPLWAKFRTEIEKVLAQK